MKRYTSFRFLFSMMMDNINIANGLRGRSWHILGVCQQMSGDDCTASRSYLTSLQHDEADYIKVPVCVRLGTMLVQHFSDC